MLHEAALDDTRWPAASASIDEACGVGGSSLVVGEGSGGEERICFVRLLYRGESRQDLAREYFDVHYPRDDGVRRLMDRAEGRLVHLPDLYTEDERKTSPVYNEGYRRLGARNGLNVHFDDPDGLRLVWAIADPVGNNGWQSDRLRLIGPYCRMFRDLGLSGLLAWDPDPASDRGPSLTIRQTLGEHAAGGRDALLTRPTLAGFGRHRRRQRAPPPGASPRSATASPPPRSSAWRWSRSAASTASAGASPSPQERRPRSTWPWRPPAASTSPAPCPPSTAPGSR